MPSDATTTPEPIQTDVAMPPVVGEDGKACISAGVSDRMHVGNRVGQVQFAVVICTPCYPW